MKLRKKLLILCFFVNTLFLFGAPVVTAELEKVSFQPGELVDVAIEIQNNKDGFHGAYFDLAYDGTILEFEDIIESSLIENESNTHELLYSLSEESQSSRIIISYTLVGDDLVTIDNGKYLTLRFRIKNQGIKGKQYGFAFNGCGLIDRKGDAIKGVTWEDSAGFVLVSPYSGSFITIREPYDNQVFYEEQISLSALLTEGDFTVKLSNSSNPAFPEKEIAVTSGVFIDEPVDLVFGKNSIYARLYDNLGNLLAADIVVVYRQSASKFIEIVSPKAHALLNNDEVWVEVKSSYKDVTINGRAATYKRSEYTGDVYYFYDQKLWLKEGFNKISASVTGPEGEKYTHTIEVYYRKDGSIFNIITPEENRSFKSSDNVNLFIMGEIASLYNTAADPSASVPSQNEVSVKVIYTPHSSMAEETVLVENGIAEIVPNTYEYENPSSKYVFTYTMEDSLNDLENGRLTIIAYKNRKGDSWENRIIRTVTIDNNRLWIDLVQPNVFTSDELDTYQKVKDFNQSLDIISDNMEVSMDGSFILSASSRKITPEQQEGGGQLTNVVSMVQRRDGSMIALVNNQPGNSMLIYKKEFGAADWNYVTELANYQGYTLCNIDIGVLVGVSCMYSSGTSDLFLLKDDKLYPVSIKDKLLNEIKYIQYIEGNVYLYRDFYNYLYSFNTYSLEERGREYFVNEIKQEAFTNYDYIQQFLLSSDTGTAAIRNNNNDILFYTKKDSGYIIKELPLLNGTSGLKGKQIIRGEYDNGDYNSYLIIKEDNTFEVIMENKNSRNLYRIDKVEAAGFDQKTAITCDVLLDETGASIVGAGFKDNNFVFLYKTTSGYFVKRGQIFFGKFYPSTNIIEDYVSNEIPQINNELVITDTELFYGIGAGAAGYPLYAAYSEYRPEGSCEFDYVNDDIDGLTGFGFEVDPGWIETAGAVEFEFSARKKTGADTSVEDEVVFKLDPITLDTLVKSTIDSEPSRYTLARSYDRSKQRAIIHFEFNRLLQNNIDDNNEYYYLQFKIKLKSSGTASPALYGMKVHKKIYPKICKSESGQILLPIHGYVTDSTVDHVTLQYNQTAKVELNRAFYHDLVLNPVNDRAEVTMECENGAGETYGLSFTVMIVDSKNDIWDISYKTVEAADYTPVGSSPLEVATTGASVNIQGKFYGLAGCILGYELYSIDSRGELLLRERGILDKEQSSDVFNEVNPGSGYEAGFITESPIILVPGKQKLILYCENPGGVRSTYEFDEINYNMKPEDQKIDFDLTGILSSPNIRNFPIEKELFLWTFESGSDPYSFTREYEISGYINTLEELSELWVRSYDPRLTFPGGKTEANISVQTGNRFKVPFTVNLEAGDYMAQLDIGVFPVKSLLAHLNKGVRIVAVKSYENTNYIPGLWAIHPDQWTEAQKLSKKVPIRLSFNREDVPLLSNTDGYDFLEARLVVNYEHEITGRVSKDENGYYLEDIETGEVKYLYSYMIKQGVNRVSWQLLFNEVEEGGTRQKLVSYSASEKPGMKDYTFVYQGKADIAPTVISFDPELTGRYYSSTDLPELSISHDISTIVTVSMDQEGGPFVLYANKGETSSVTLGYDEFKEAIREGKNTLVVSYTEEGQSQITNRYSFMYDDEFPVCKIDTYNFSDDFKQLLEITAIVEEANYAEGFLYYGTDIVNALPEVVIRSDRNYNLVWKNLDGFDIQPSILKEVKIKVKDRAGNPAESEALTGFTEQDRPEETDIKEIKIELPVYRGLPELAGEANYQGRDFPVHTKITPRKFLKRVGIKDQLEQNDNYLIKYGKPSDLEPVYWSKMDNIVNVTEPEIGSAVLTAGQTSPYFDPYAKFGSALMAHTTSGNRSYSFNINNAANLHRGALSFWSYTAGWQAQVIVHFGATHMFSVGVLRDSPGNWFYGTEFGHTSGLHHYYIIWDKDKAITGGKSMVLYRDGAEVLFSSADLPVSFEKITVTAWCGAPTSGDYSAEASVDNLKVWDYIPMEKPAWLYNNPKEDRTIPPYVNTPVYWSRCESLENITNTPDIGVGSGTVSGYYNIEGEGKFGNHLAGNTPGGTITHFNPRGEDFTIPKKGTLSFWMKKRHDFDTRNAFNLELGGFGFQWKAEGIGFYVNKDPQVLNINQITNGDWHHVYITWDDDVGLTWQTIRLYIDNTLMFNSIQSIDSWIYHSPFRFTWWDDGEGSCAIDLDNIKLWDKVIHEHPGWLEEVEGKEDQFGWTEKSGDSFDNETQMTPVYYSECNSWGNIETANIGSAELIDTDQWGTTTDPALTKYGTALHARTSWQLDDQFQVNNTALDSGTISFWSGILNAKNHNYFRIFLSDSTYMYIGIFNGNWGALVANGVHVSNIIPMPNNVLSHIYIVWDKEKQLEGGKSLRIFCGSQEIGSTTADLGAIETQNIRFELYINQDTGHSGSDPVSFSLDDLKIWDNVISEDPNYVAAMDETTSLSADYGKYLVFKVAKDVQTIKSKEDIKDRIWFELIGKKWDSAAGHSVIVPAIEEERKIPLTGDDPYTYIEGEGYVYYMVDTGILKTAFEQKKSFYTTPGIGALDPNQSSVIIDPGSLKIMYDPGLVDFSPKEIYLVGHPDGPGGEKYTTLEDCIVYDSRYESPSLVGEYTLAHTEIRHPLDEGMGSIMDRTFYHEASGDTLSVNFWFRIEDEALEEDLFAGRLRRLFTFSDASSNELLYLAYNYDAGQKSGMLHLIDGNQSYEIGPTPVGPDGWNMVTSMINGLEKKLVIHLITNTGIETKEFDLSEDVISRITAADSTFFFGSSESEEYNTGFYSIALPSYINRILSNEEIVRLYNLRDTGIGGSELIHTFTEAESEFVQGKLLKTGATGHFADEENAGYSPDLALSGSLKASGDHRNFLKTSETSENSGRYIVIFDEARQSTSHNMDVTPGTDSFTLVPRGEGIYYFGDKTGNWGLGLDRWYSVKGKVLSMAEDTDANLILRINGNEQSFKLTPGTFHFVYNNESGAVPSEVKMYIESDGEVTLDKNMVLNEGNYTIPHSMEKTAAYETFPFDLTGTVHFRYKPFNINKDGFVNYETVLFDSEYIQIGTRLADGDAVYYGIIKKADGSTAILLDTNTKVSHRWQHIQLSYSCKEDAAYLTIDGKLAAGSEGAPLPLFGSLLGNIEDEEYIYLGSNKEKTLFAEGFLDRIEISKYFLSNRYEDITPVTFHYDPENLVIEEENVQSSSEITEPLYRVEALEAGLTDGVSSCIETASLEALNQELVKSIPGRYRLTASMKVNGLNFKEILYFNIDNKPKFSLVGHTPIVFAPGSENLTNDISFTLVYDSSYRFAEEDLVYPGAAVTISYTTDSGEVATGIRYLVQDYQNQLSSQWLLGVPLENGEIYWQLAEPGNAGELTLMFEQIKCTSDVEYSFTYFYFTEIFDPLGAASAPAEEMRLIPLAAINTEKGVYQVEEKEDGLILLKDYEYKMIVSVLDKTGGSVDSKTSAIFEEMEIAYTVRNSEGYTAGTGSVPLNSTGLKEFYYDDILPGYGEFSLDLILKYKAVAYAELKGKQLSFTKPKKMEESSIITGMLQIDEFSILYLDKETNRVNLFLRYFANGVGSIATSLDIIRDGKIWNRDKDGSEGVKGFLSNINTSFIYQDIEIPKGASKVRITISADGLQTSQELELNNFVSAPDLVLTNYVESEIAYNDVFFSWKGYYEGIFNSEVEYTYNFDDTGWTSRSTSWRDVHFYDLDEGYHSFFVKAVYNEVESLVRGITFFVDVNRPVFDPSLIEVEKLYNSQGVLYAVNIIGHEGAIKDASLRGLTVNSQSVSVSEDGKFVVNDLTLTKDGINEFVLSAYDKVNNFKEYILEVNNPVTNILFPGAENVLYCPLTIVGKIDSTINAPMAIYVRDPFCEDREAGDYTGWKKARINEDRTFFIEDVFVNPGLEEKFLTTTLTLVSVFESGEEFTKELHVTAGEIVMPIELSLSTHASEGENVDTYVEIDCRANVTNISTWSIDYTGDGIYDEIDLVTNPDDTADSNVHSWTHKYSTLGLVKPRVRIITTDGNFFSVADSLIIHEKIKEASNKMILEPISLDTVHLEDNSKRVFVLSGDGSHHMVDVYEVGRNENYISNKLYEIDLTSLGIGTTPVQVRAYGKEHLFVAENLTEGAARIYELKAGEFGNYRIGNIITLDEWIYDISHDSGNLYVSYLDSGKLTRFAIKEAEIDVTSRMDSGDESPIALGMSASSAVSKDKMGLLVADYLNQRVLRLSDTFDPINYYGSFGNREGEFLKPSIIKSYENRIFVYDEGRKDIQIFDHEFTTVCTLGYSIEPGYNNYLEPEFFNKVIDMEIITKEENNRLYYYALLLSKSAGKLAMLRLPQWEELRARVRNNKVVFIKDGELFTAKPDGSDLTKILSSDSLPRIEGQLDYPALSPDGKSLVFTSRTQLYNGENVGQGENNLFAYDNLYVVDIETKVLQKIVPGNINGYEIERPVFNSNGDKLIFSAKQTGSRWQIYVYDLKENTLAKLFESDENARFPYYSPDDRFVVFTTDYDGDEEIEIIDTENTSLRVSVTNNYARDSVPVWNRIYPYEISGNSDKKIESKIAFVSERDYHKGIYYVYIKRASDSDIRIVTKEGFEIGNDPDSAASEITNENVEGDYPCFTGDGTALVFEYFDGEKEILKKYSFTEPDDALKLTNMELPGSAGRPAGMKNMIADFQAAPVDGNRINLTWNRYTENDIFYIVRFKENKVDAPYTEKKVFSQTGTVLAGLEMGASYLVKVCILEMEEEVASSQWKKVKMPSVAARLSYAIDTDNPYLVHLHGWEPHDRADGGINHQTPDKTWEYVWLIDNREYSSGYSQDYSYHFAASGKKTVALKVSTSTEAKVSEPVTVDIKTDIQPVIEYVLSEDSSYVELNASNSKGSNIDFAETIWTITGPGVTQSIIKNGSVTSVDLTGYLHKIYVNLKLKRKTVGGQPEVETIEKNMVIDLDFKELKPVITTSVNEENNRFINFSGEYSLGNIDWYRAEWTIFADNGIIYQKSGASTIEYLFPTTNSDTVYTVSLSVPRKNDNKNETVSQIVNVEAAPTQPVIDYQVLTLEEGGLVVGAKLLLDCTKSKGSGIDFANARWNVGYGGQGVQAGPTALYDLIGADQNMVIDVSLTLMRQGGKDPVTFNELINLTTGELPDSKLIVVVDEKDSTSGKTLIFDARQSTGPNIDWERTDWQIDGQPYSKRGPVARIDFPASSEKQIINYTCTLYRTGGGSETVTGSRVIGKTEIYPVISTRRLSQTQKNVYELSVLDTKGANIDWERTHWYIYDGAENVNEKRGATVQHAFTLKTEAMGYPVLVELYLTGGSKPYTAYTNIDVEGDDLKPIITYDADPENPNVVTFTASTSKGNNIDWNSAKWTFGDSSEYGMGSTVSHKYPVDSVNRSYRVSLTLSRRSTNGIAGTPVTVYKTITIGADEIKPVIKVEEYSNGYLVLSAEDSEGRGLMLDRSVWLFEGKGDSGTFNENTNLGFGLSESFTKSTLFGLDSVSSVGMLFPLTAIKTSTKLRFSNTFGMSQNVNQSLGSSFSETNTHHGAVCRRFVGPLDNIIVTLMVYRVENNGEIKGESITINVDLSKTGSGDILK